MSRWTQRLRLGLRKEVVLLLPIAVVLLVLLSSFTVFSYRNAVHLLRDQRREEALHAAVRMAEMVAGSEDTSAADLLRGSPGALRVLLIRHDGQITSQAGRPLARDPLELFRDRDLNTPVAVGPDKVEAVVSGLAATKSKQRDSYLRVDLEAAILARQLAGVRVLTIVVVVADVALTMLVLLFLRHLLTPYDRMLERARALWPEGQPIEDEVAFLVSSFEKAVTTAHRGEMSTVDEVETLSRTLGPNLRSGMLLLSTHGEVLALNTAGAEILALPEPQGRPALSQLLYPHPELGEVLARALATETPVHRTILELNRDEKPISVGLSCSPLRRDDGTVRAYLVLFADVTEVQKQQAEERLAASLNQVGDLAAGVAHEMRNSLATFRGYLTLVERSPEEESLQSYLVELRRETDHLYRVLEDFLSFARPESTRMKTSNLAVVARRAAADPALESYRVVTSFPEDAPLILGDEQLLERAVRNLLHNAVQASRAVSSDQPIHLAVVREHEEFELTVADRGGGVPAEIRDRLFEPFVSGRQGGVGLGLALAHRIVNLHGGNLELLDRPDGGTVARARFPAA